MLVCSRVQSLLYIPYFCLTRYVSRNFYFRFCLFVHSCLHQWLERWDWDGVGHHCNRRWCSYITDIGGSVARDLLSTMILRYLLLLFVIGDQLTVNLFSTKTFSLVFYAIIGLYTPINYFGRYATCSHKDGGRSIFSLRKPLARRTTWHV